MNTPAAPPRSRTSGFSLIELIFVLVLLGILTSLAGPRLNAWITQTQVERAASELMADLSYARTLAVRSGQQSTITLEANRYTIRADGRVAKTVEIAADAPGMQLSTTIAAGTLPPGTLPVQLQFNSRGLLVTNVATPNNLISLSRNAHSARLEIMQTGRANLVY